MDTLCYDFINKDSFRKAIGRRNERRKLNESQVKKINIAFNILNAMRLTDIWVQEFCIQRNVPQNAVDIIKYLSNSTIDARFIDRTLTWAASRYGHAFWCEKNEIFKEMFKKASEEEENPYHVTFSPNDLDFFVGVAEPAGGARFAGDIRVDAGHEDIEAF